MTTSPGSDAWNCKELQALQELQRMVDCSIEENKRVGLALNTANIVLSKCKIIPSCNIKVHGEEIKQVRHFKYLGYDVTENAKPAEEVNYRIAQTI